MDFKCAQVRWSTVQSTGQATPAYGRFLQAPDRWA